VGFRSVNFQRGQYPPEKLMQKLGNGWATMGMLRVLSIIQRSPWEKDMKGQQQNLKGWTHEILKGVYWGGNLVRPPLPSPFPLTPNESIPCRMRPRH
jgi:hypothetical protein